MEIKWPSIDYRNVHSSVNTELTAFTQTQKRFRRDIFSQKRVSELAGSGLLRQLPFLFCITGM